MTAARSDFEGALFPLATLDPAAALDDLSTLLTRIDDNVRIVAIGESAHGAHEFYALRHRLIRFLVERMNFTAVVWESGFPEGFIVNDFLHGTQHDRAQAQIDGMTMHMGRCDEFGNLLEWLAARNIAQRDSLRFYGLDLPESLPLALNFVADFLQTVDAGSRARVERLQALAATICAPAATDPNKLKLAGTAILQQFLAIPAPDRNELTALLADQLARFDALRRTYLERSDQSRYDIARQHLRVAAALDLQLRAVAALMAGDASACEGNIRDATMASTVDWILAREQRIIVLAHNGHIQKTPIATPTGTAKSVDTLGVHLAERWRKKYLTIGTTVGEGEIIAMRSAPGAASAYETEFCLRDLPPAGAEVIDTVLHANISQLALLDLRELNRRAAATIDAANRMRMQDLFTEIDVRKSFDILIHVPRISPWTSPANATMPDTRAKLE